MLGYCHSEEIGNMSISESTTVENREHEEGSSGNGSDREGCPEEEREFDSDIRLARVEFERVETIFVILVFIMVVVLAKMSKPFIVMCPPGVCHSDMQCLICCPMSLQSERKKWWSNMTFAQTILFKPLFKLPGYRL